MNSREIALFSTAALLGAVSSALVFSHFRELKNRCSQNDVVRRKPSRHKFITPLTPKNGRGISPGMTILWQLHFYQLRGPRIQIDKLATPYKRKSKSGDPLETKYPYVCHAEVNAILNTNHASAAGQRLYVTMFPCNECAKIIIQSGVSEVIYYVEKRLDNPDAAYVASHKLLSMAGIKVRRHQPQMDQILIKFNEL